MNTPEENQLQRVFVERQLRMLLAEVYAAHRLYTDDGELSDSSMHPSIDFLRDSPLEIKQKMMQRVEIKMRKLEGNENV